MGRPLDCRDFVDFVSREVEKDASMLKQIRNAREKRHLAHKSKKEETYRLRAGQAALSCLACPLYVCVFIVCNVLARDDGTPRRARSFAFASHPFGRFARWMSSSWSFHLLNVGFDAVTTVFSLENELVDR